MTDSFFKFDDATSNDVFDEGMVSDEEDEDYDALNSETFGDDTWGGDWEEDHEKLAELAELSRHSYNNENGDLSDKIASLILDDDEIDKPVKHIEHLERNDFLIDGVGRPKPRPPPGFIPNDGFHIEPPSPSPSLHQNILNLKNVCTVEEIERGLINKLPGHGLRLEDIERNIMSSSSLSSQVVGGSSRGVPGPVLHHLARSPPPLPGLSGQFPFAPPPTAPVLPPHPILLRNVWSGNGAGGAPGVAPGVAPGGAPGGAPGVGTSPGGQVRPLDEDPYAGLMTYNDKQWIAGIQLVQLSCSHPFHNDYYYIMYQHRQSGGRKIGTLKTPRENAAAHFRSSYTPLQFENSLGKLQAGSVTAPRKLIDTEVVEKGIMESQAPNLSSTKKFKQILLEIEQMYSDVLKAEEVLSPLVPPSNDNYISPLELFTKTINFLMRGDKFKTVFNVRKGKTLIVRVMCHCEVSGPLARRLLSLLPEVARQDPDQALLQALPAVRHYLQQAQYDAIIALANQLYPHLHFLLQDQFGVSVVANMLERGEAVCSAEEPAWRRFVGGLGQTDSPRQPVVRVSRATLLRILVLAEPPLSSLSKTVLIKSLATSN